MSDTRLRKISVDGFRNMSKYDAAWEKGQKKHGQSAKYEERVAQLGANIYDCLNECQRRARQIQTLSKTVSTETEIWEASPPIQGFIILVFNDEYYMIDQETTPKDLGLDD